MVNCLAGWGHRTWCVDAIILW